MSQLEMAMAVNGTVNHTGIVPGGQAPENCWPATAWEHQTPTESGSMEGNEGGDYSAERMDWDLKANSWEWENITMVYPGRSADSNQRLQPNDWTNGSCSVVTLATPGGSKAGDFSIGLASGSSAPFGMTSSVSSGIPGLAASRGSGGHDLSSLVKNEPDEDGVGQTVVGTPVSATEQQKRLLFGFSGVQTREVEERGSGKEGDEEPKPSLLHGNGGSAKSAARGGDTFNIGLKLGRRTYFEDSAAGGGGGQKGSPAPAHAFSPPGKKQRPMSPRMQIPRCQVEGCKADLSSAKDYHRRHKVCEMHSKASKAIAAGQEQRFCQQCSRFHVLTEFDEGKRSCRRRLAGHNERRRKPHPDSHSALGLRSSPLHSDISSFTMDDSKRSCFLQQHRGSTSSSASLEDNNQPSAHGLKLTTPWSFMRRDENGLACQLQAASAERQSIFSTLSRPTADRLLMLLQSPKTQMAPPHPSPGMAMGAHQFMEGPLGPLGQGLSLSSAGGVLGSVEQNRVGACSQGLSTVSGLADSCRALSLLSTQSWASRPPPRAPAPVPLDHPQAAANSTLEQLVAGSSDNNNRGSPFSHHLQIPSGGSPTSDPHQHYEKLFPMQSGGLGSIGLNCGQASPGNQVEQQRRCGRNIFSEFGEYDGTPSMIALMQAGHEFRAVNSGVSTSHQSRPTIDLMQMPSQAHHNGHHGNGSQSQSSNGQYSEFSSMQPFESSIFSTQQML